METSKGNPDLTDPFRLGHGDSESFKGRTEREHGNGQLGMERSGKEGTILYKDRLPSSPSPHFLSMLLVAFSHASLLVAFAV